MDIYVVIPGIAGSVLQKNGRDAFGLTAQAGLRGLFSAGGSLGELLLIDDPPDIDDLGDGVQASRLARDAHLIPGLWKIDGYGRQAAFLRQRLRLTPGQDYFEFPYDWRRDNRVAARQLALFAGEWLRVRRQTCPDARLVLIAHSMGGLIARYYLEVLGGWRDTKALITFGAPFRGSLNALDYLVNGKRRALGLVDLTGLVRSFTSIYQLLPTYRCVDGGDGKLLRLTELPFTLPGLDPARVTAAREFHREIERAVTAHRDDPEYRDRGYRLHKVVGTEQPTNQSALWRDRSLTMLCTYGGRNLNGDGTVPRVAAFPPEEETETGAMYSSARHASMQNTDAVLNQLRGWMTDTHLGIFRAGAPISLALEIADVQPAANPTHATVLPSVTTGDLHAELVWVGGPMGPTPPIVVTLPGADGPRPIEIPQRAPGCYRLTIRGDADVAPVSDLVVVSP